MLKYLRFILFPFSFLYYVVTFTRNKFYDLEIFKSYSFKTKVICIGNLSTGGTGKTPHTDFLIKLFKDKKIAVLSRGYGRKTKGIVLGSKKSTSESLGDEPLQILKNNPNINVIVCENRVQGINFIEKELSPEIIILDDGFQHRKVKPHFSMILTDYNKLFTKDFLLPVGDLRENRGSVKRSNLIIVTKIPSDITLEKKNFIKSKISKYTKNEVLFSEIKYSDLKNFKNEILSIKSLKDKKVLLITGISNPKPLEKYLIENRVNFSHKEYNDHHNFSNKEINEIQNIFNQENYDYILTTEKDFARIGDKFSSEELLYIPIKVDVKGIKNILL